MWENNSCNDEEGEAVGAISFDPFADLLLGLIAIIVPIIGLLLAGGNGHKTNTERERFAVPGEKPFLIIAHSQGISVPVDRIDGSLEISLERILEDADLVRILSERRDGAQPISLRIEQDGLESAFLFESVVAKHGPSTIRQMRVSAAP